MAVTTLRVIGDILPHTISVSLQFQKLQGRHVGFISCRKCKKVWKVVWYTKFNRNRRVILKVVQSNRRMYGHDTVSLSSFMSTASLLRTENLVRTTLRISVFEILWFISLDEVVPMNAAHLLDIVSPTTGPASRNQQHPLRRETLYTSCCDLPPAGFPVPYGHPCLRSESEIQ
jgi:hypothetical protein